MGIPTVRDRVVQQYGCTRAVRKAEAYLESGYHWVVDADIQGFFDHVDHMLLMDLACEKISYGKVLSLIESFLKSGIMNEGILEASTEGTPRVEISARCCQIFI